MAKKRDTFGDSPLGSGGRFAECVKEMKKRPGVYDPAGLCASIGRKAYGKKRFQKMAKRGRGNPSREKRTGWRGYQKKAVILPSRRWAEIAAVVEIYLDQAEDQIAHYGGREDVLEEVKVSPHMHNYVVYSDALADLLEAIAGGIMSGPTAPDPALREDLVHGRRGGLGLLGDRDRRRLALIDDNFQTLFWVQSLAEIRQSADEGIDPGLGLVEAAVKVIRGGPGTVVDLGSGYLLLDANDPQVPRENPCGAEGYGAAANPVKPDGRWHKTQFIDVGEEKGTAYGMQTAKGGATIVPYKPRTFTGSRFAAEIYEDYRAQKIPKGSRFIVIVKGEAKGSPLDPSAHKSLDDAKKAGESALRKLPMPGARSNPAELVGAGLLSLTAPIPSGIDNPPVNAGILAGSRPIPSGFRDPFVNVGLVDPPLTRRSKPEQPT